MILLSYNEKILGDFLGILTGRNKWIYLYNKSNVQL